jgi:hypothetical protein
MATYTNLSALKPGALLATLGMQLYARLEGAADDSESVRSAYYKLRHKAFPRRRFIPLEALDSDDYHEEGVWVETPGLLRRRFSNLQNEVKEVKDLTLAIASPLLNKDTQITFLIDGLDRLIKAESFREFSEQDLRALRGTKITVIVVAPLLLLYDKSRFLHDYFDLVKHIPAANKHPRDTAFLRDILERRGALELLNRAELNSLVRFSGGVLRDLITLTSSAAAYAYRDQQDRIGPRHVRAAVNQLGNRYLVGLGSVHKHCLRRLAEDKYFDIEDSVSLELLVNRQVLECFYKAREFFTIHPALARILPKSE